MATRYFSWQQSTDDACAIQMSQIGANMSVEPFKTLLGISDANAKMWVACAAEYAWLQNLGIPQSDSYKQALVGARDVLTHGPESGPYVRPTQPAPFPPTPPAGVVLRNDFFDFANILVKQWKANPAFTDDLQRQMGLVVPISAAATAAKEVPFVRQIKVQSGGVVMVDAFVGRADMVIVQLNVDGAGWPDVTEGGKNQKTISGSRAEFKLTPGVAHSVQIREAFANRSGEMQGDWSEVKTVSSLA